MHFRNVKSPAPLPKNPGYFMLNTRLLIGVMHVNVHILNYLHFISLFTKRGNFIRVEFCPAWYFIRHGILSGVIFYPLTFSFIHKVILILSSLLELPKVYLGIPNLKSLYSNAAWSRNEVEASSLRFKILKNAQSSILNHQLIECSHEILIDFKLYYILPEFTSNSNLILFNYKYVNFTYVMKGCKFILYFSTCFAS